MRTLRPLDQVMLNACLPPLSFVWNQLRGIPLSAVLLRPVDDVRQRTVLGLLPIRGRTIAFPALAGPTGASALLDRRRAGLGPVPGG